MGMSLVRVEKWAEKCALAMGALAMGALATGALAMGGLAVLAHGEDAAPTAAATSAQPHASQLSQDAIGVKPSAVITPVQAPARAEGEAPTLVQSRAANGKQTPVAPILHVAKGGPSASAAASPGAPNASAAPGAATAAGTATASTARKAPAAQSASAVGAPPLRHGVFRFQTYPAAWTAAQKSNRPILVYVSAPQCPYCVRMLAETFQSPNVRETVIASYETVYVDHQTSGELVAALGVKMFPTTVLVDPNNQVTDVMEGYVAADAFRRRIQTNLASTPTAAKR